MKLQFFKRSNFRKANIFKFPIFYFFFLFLENTQFKLSLVGNDTIPATNISLIEFQSRTKILILDSQLSTNDHILKLQELFSKLEGSISIDFNNCIIDGNNITLNIFNSFSTSSHVILSNLTFVNLHTKLLSNLPESFHFKNLLVTNSSFHNIYDIVSVSDNMLNSPVVSFDNLTISNTSFYSTSFLAAKNIQLNLEVHLYNVYFDLPLFFLCQVELTLSSFILSNSTISDKINIFDLKGESQIKGTNISILNSSSTSQFNESSIYVISLDFFSDNILKNVSFNNSNRISLLKGPVNSFSFHNIFIKNCNFSSDFLNIHIADSVKIFSLYVNNSFSHSSFIVCDFCQHLMITESFLINSTFSSFFSFADSYVIINKLYSRSLISHVIHANNSFLILHSSAIQLSPLLYGHSTNISISNFSFFNIHKESPLIELFDDSNASVSNCSFSNIGNNIIVNISKNLFLSNITSDFNYSFISNNILHIKQSFIIHGNSFDVFQIIFLTLSLITQLFLIFKITHFTLFYPYHLR